MTDSQPARPRPQYGEYATPEEQRARIADPGAAAALEAAAAPVAQTAEHRRVAGSEEHAAPQLASPRPTTTAARPTRTADRIITIALLAYGLVTVLGAIPQLVDFAGFARTWMDMAGIDGTLTDPAAGRAWGIAGAVVFAAGWLLTAVLAWWSLSRRRLSWWIPLVGAIVTFVIVSLCLSVPLLSDPAILNGFSGS